MAQPDTVFLTGATGFVGAHVLEQLRAAGYRVRALVRPPGHPDAVTRRPELVTCHPELVEGLETTAGDLRHTGELARVLDGCRYLVHCAARYSFAPRDRAEIGRVNVAGTEGLFAAAHLAGVERAVLTSSSAAVGPQRGAHPPGEDDYPPHHAPRNAPDYHFSKLLQERAAFASRVPTIAILPTAPVGAADWKPTPTGGMILDFLRGRMVARPPVSGGMNVVDVEQVAQAHVAALESGRIGERYIVAGENLTFDELWERLAEATGRAAPRLRAPVPLMFAAAYADEARCRITGAAPLVPLEGVRMSRERMFVDGSKAVRELGVEIRLAAPALARAVAWYREHGYAA